MKRNYLIRFFLCVAIFGYKCQDKKAESVKNKITFEEKQKKELAKNPALTELAANKPQLNFRYAATKGTVGVVHVKSTYTYDPQEILGQYYDDFWFRFFYDGGVPKIQSEASGVIVSSDGYIVTNDHVVADATEIEIILNDQKKYTAKIIGIDTDTDLALLKIDAKDLSFLEFGNSDDVEVGDWVLAIGNPFDLTSTVTAGIVSAKGRNINLMKKKGAIESFIQTDAAVNPGNSGGALVDYQGKLVGINTAIATLTGRYTGYSFATPINIVKKIINDLLNDGKVKRGYFGAILKNVTANESEQLNTEITTGIYVDSLIEGGAAQEAELKTKDIITGIDGRKITTTANMQELLALHSPGEKITLTVIRKGNEKTVNLTLKEREGSSVFTTAHSVALFNKLGIKISELSEREKKRMRINNGMKVLDVKKGLITKFTNIKPGFVITRINNSYVNTEEDFVRASNENKSILIVEGTYPYQMGIYKFVFTVD